MDQPLNSEKDIPLREDIRLLGRILGDTVRSQEGDAVFDIIEGIGSRPASRTSSMRIEDLRAIPWVFSWAQCRLMLPGWYGFGAAVKAWLNAHPAEGMSILRPCMASGRSSRRLSRT